MGTRLRHSDAILRLPASLRSTAVALALAVLTAGGLAGCGSSASTLADAPTANRLEGLLLNPRQPAPPLVLHNFTGQSVSLTALQGRAVFVTFVYTHCPDVCPLIVSNLSLARRGLGTKAHYVQMLAVTVDPHRDTPRAIHVFLAARGALGRMDYLLGSDSQLLRTWKAWHVEVMVNKKLLTTGHSAAVYGITASGRMAVVYPSDFTPAQIIHDAPLLARM
jgi:protein SCO1